MKANKLHETQLRSLIRKEISKILKEEDEQVPEKERGADKEAPKKQEPKDDRNEVLEKITLAFSKSLKNNLQQLSTEELASSVDSLLNHFGLGKDSKIEVLKSLRNKIQL